MKPLTPIKSIFITSISYFCILLFTYAGASKWLDYQNFSVQLGQSPLLSNYAQTIAYAVPGIEFLLVLLLLFPKFKSIGLWGSLSLMVMFTAYIYIILHYSSFIPCSCGGILEKLTWQQHLLFNMAVVIGIFCALLWQHKNKVQTLILVSVISLISITCVTVLYLMSENSIQYHNKFIRRLSHGPAIKTNQINLQYNSYYFAGIHHDTIYLGNNTAQLLITAVDTLFQSAVKHKIELDKKDNQFSFLKLKVAPPYFYVYDGTIPGIYKGKTNTWKANFAAKPTEYFSLAEPTDTSALVVRTQQRISGESVLAKIHYGQNKSTTTLHKNLLQKQLDGVFDTDGHLLWSQDLKKIIYLYAYRNQFIVTDKNLNLTYRGNTIDTISKAKLDIVNIKSHNEKKLGKRPLVVNKNAAVYNNLLFVNSGIPGRYESLTMWKQASIIDVYNLSDKSYITSFYINDINSAKLKSFIVHKNQLYALIGNYLVQYQLTKTINKHYQK